jgi:hypothetical protein
MRNDDAKKDPGNEPYQMDIRITFDQRIQEEVVCSLLEDMRLAIQTHYPVSDIQLIGDDAICSDKMNGSREHREQQVPD